MLFSECENSKQQGNIALGQAIAYFTSKRYVVLLPLNDAQEYDLVVDINGILNKVQVKSTKCKAPSGAFQVSVKSSGGSKREVYHHVCESDCDYLFVTTDNCTNYLIPREIFINNKSSINLTDQLKEFIVF